MSKRKRNQTKVVDTPEEGYPIKRNPNAKGEFNVLEGINIYKFIQDDQTDGRWLAVLLIDSSWEYPYGSGQMQSAKSVRVYRWRYREEREYKGRDEETDRAIFENTGKMIWLQEQEMTISQKRWDEVINAVDELLPKSA